REVTEMDGAGRVSAFAGDLDDFWVASIASALGTPVCQIHCPSNLPEAWPESVRQAELVVVHRGTLCAVDIERLRALRMRAAEPGARAVRVLLIYGPHARYSELQRTSSVVDVLIPESIAADVVGRYTQDESSLTKPGAGSKVAVVSRLRELRLVLS